MYAVEPGSGHRAPRVPSVPGWRPLAALLFLVVGFAAIPASSEEPPQVPLYGALGHHAPQESVRIEFGESAAPGPFKGVWLHVVTDVPARDDAAGVCRALRRTLPAQQPGTPAPQWWQVTMDVYSQALTDSCPDGPVVGLIGPLDRPWATLELEGARIMQVWAASPLEHASRLAAIPWERWPATWSVPEGWTILALADGRLDLESDTRVMVRLSEGQWSGLLGDACDACTCIRDVLHVDTGTPFEVALVLRYEEPGDGSEVPCARMPDFEGYADLSILAAGSWTFPSVGSVTVALHPPGEAPD